MNVGGKDLILAIWWLKSGQKIQKEGTQSKSLILCLHLAMLLWSVGDEVMKVMPLNLLLQYIWQP